MNPTMLANAAFMLIGAGLMIAAFSVSFDQGLNHLIYGFIGATVFTYGLLWTRRAGDDLDLERRLTRRRR